MDEPDFLMVEEAARVLRIGRTTAYKEAKRFLATNGAEGIPIRCWRSSPALSVGHGWYGRIALATERRR